MKLWKDIMKLKEEARILYVENVLGTYVSFVFRGILGIEYVGIDRSCRDVVERFSQEGVSGEISYIIAESACLDQLTSVLTRARAISINELDEKLRHVVAQGSYLAKKLVLAAIKAGMIGVLRSDRSDDKPTR